MITVTLAHGAKSQLDGSLVIRIRLALDSDSHWNPVAKTLVNWVEPMLIQEEPGWVAKAVQNDGGALAEFTLLKKDASVWVDARSSKGPLPLLASLKREGYNSILIVGGKRQPVKETHQEVWLRLKEAGGKPLSIPIDPPDTRSLDDYRQFGFSVEPPLWDE